MVRVNCMLFYGPAGRGRRAVARDRASRMRTRVLRRRLKGRRLSYFLRAVTGAFPGEVSGELTGAGARKKKGLSRSPYPHPHHPPPREIPAGQADSRETPPPAASETIGDLSIPPPPTHPPPPPPTAVAVVDAWGRSCLGALPTHALAAKHLFCASLYALGRKALIFASLYAFRPRPRSRLRNAPHF